LVYLGCIIIVDNLIKLEILENIKDFDILFNNFRNKYFFHRESVIDEILGEKSNFEKATILGEFYIGSYRNQMSVSNATHMVEHISKENKIYYAYIRLLKHDLKGIDSSSVNLRPIYYNYTNGYHPTILTFDLEYKKGYIYGKIMERK